MDILNLIKSSYKNLDLTRPDWTIDISRDESLMWLNKNENLDPDLNLKINGLLKKIKPYAVNTYPETAKIYKKLAVIENLPEKSFLLTCGSDGSIRTIFDVFVNPQDKVLRTSPTFAMYEVYSKMYGATEIICEYDASDLGPKLDFEKFISLVKNERPKLICLPNPDSPSGTVLSKENFACLLETAKEISAILLIDEAYFPFYEFTAAPYVKDYPNLFVCRSFSKAWGAAGLRVGYIIGNEKYMSYLHKNRPMYEISTFSTEMIDQLLNLKEEVFQSVKRLKMGAEYFKKEMEELGYKVVLTNGNFLHVNFGVDDQKISDLLKPIVLYRSNFNNAKSLNGFSRFSLGTREQFEVIVQKIKSMK